MIPPNLACGTWIVLSCSSTPIPRLPSPTMGPHFDHNSIWVTPFLSFQPSHQCLWEISPKVFGAYPVQSHPGKVAALLWSPSTKPFQVPSLCSVEQKDVVWFLQMNFNPLDSLSIAMWCLKKCGTVVVLSNIYQGWRIKGATQKRLRRK